MNAETAEHVGIQKLKQFLMVSIKEFPRGISDQAISKEPATAGNQRSPGPGPKHQASSDKLKEPQASSGKHQAPSSKHQA